MYVEMKDKKIDLVILFDRFSREQARFHKNSIPRWVKTGRAFYVYKGEDVESVVFQKRNGNNEWVYVGLVNIWTDFGLTLHIYI